MLRAAVPMDTPAPPASMDFLTLHTASDIEETLHMADSAIDGFLVAAMLVICAYRKNNNFTAAAQQADRLLAEMRENEQN